MRAKKRKSGWFVEPETEEEENALIAFLSVYKRVSVSTDYFNWMFSGG